MRTRTVAFLALAALGVTLPAAPAAAAGPVDALLARMTLPQKVGQLFTTYVHGAAADTPSAENRRLYGAAGINQAWAPVADVNVNPANPVIGVRSFGSDPRLAAALTASQIAGFQRGAGISASAKHFPGHGDTATDSHTGLPVITHTLDEWRRLDAPPFRAAVTAAQSRDLTVVLTNNATDSRQQALVTALLGTGRPVVVVAVRNPYDLVGLPGVQTYLATYSYTGVAMQSLARVLTGVVPPRGKLPVEIPGLFPYGHGLTWRVPR